MICLMNFNMPYELAKQLKDAGFPTAKCTCVLMHDENGCITGWHEPNLSELIEACGDKFKSITRYGKDCWDADSEGADPDWSTDGETPETAIANLWLELNKK